MARKINEKIELPIEKITNEPFDQIIGHSVSERIYFTVENNDIIYKRLREELDIEYLPYLGPCVDFGAGDICLEESHNTFKFYIIDRSTKFEYEEFENIKDGIKRLINYYKKYNLVNDPNKMEEIFYQALGLKKEDKIQENKTALKRKLTPQ